MTAPSLAPAVDGARDVPDLASSLRDLAQAAVGYTAAKASRAVDRMTPDLRGVLEPRGATDRATVEGAKALVVGKNPVWAAIKGAWTGADGKVRAAVIGVLLLILLLAPVVLLLLLLALLVAAAVAGIRAAAR